jgi:predicted secreted protein with PEFG-CTERM motif
MSNTKAIGAGAAVILAILGGVIYNSHLNLEFDLILPDGNSTHAILSSDNYTHLQNNVGIETVTNVHNTQANATVGYCKIAEFIHLHQDGYANKAVGNGTIFTATIPPKWCNSEINPVKIPEFGNISMLILIISIIGILAMGIKSGGRFSRLK